MANFNNTSALAALQYNKKIKEYEANDVFLDERSQAALFGQCLELQVLKAPATAVFPPFDEMVVNGSDGRYIVSAFVDSQNSYGATIRTNYTYNIEKDGDSWKCTDTFVDTSAQISKDINTSILGNTIIYWILGIIGTIITYFIISASIF